MPLDVELYPFHYLTPSDLSPDIGEELQSGRTTGIVVEDFLSAEEIASIIRGFRNVSDNRLTKVDAGFTSYPESFAQFTQALQNASITEEQFHKSAADFRTEFKIRFGVDIEAKLSVTLQKLFSDRKVEVPADKGGYGSFIPFTFRELFPGNGELKVHCENLFFNEFPFFFTLLDHVVLRQNEFSFFIVLSEAEKGGELSLYDINWRQVKNRNTFTHLADASGNIFDIENDEVKRQYVKPKAGSLVIFSGGDIWHRIEIVQGTRSRITLGGFISQGVDNEKLYLWS